MLECYWHRLELKNTFINVVNLQCKNRLVSLNECVSGCCHSPTSDILEARHPIKTTPASWWWCSCSTDQRFALCLHFQSLAGAALLWQTTCESVWNKSKWREHPFSPLLLLPPSEGWVFSSLIRGRWRRQKDNVGMEKNDRRVIQPWCILFLMLLSIGTKDQHGLITVNIQLF